MIESALVRATVFEEANTNFTSTDTLQTDRRKAQYWDEGLASRQIIHQNNYSE